jgi:hypothetical protein
LKLTSRLHYLWPESSPACTGTGGGHIPSKWCKGDTLVITPSGKPADLSLLWIIKWWSKEASVSLICGLRAVLPTCSEIHWLPRPQYQLQTLRQSHVPWLHPWSKASTTCLRTHLVIQYEPFQGLKEMTPLYIPDNGPDVSRP